MNIQDYANLGMAAMTGDATYARTVSGQAVFDREEAAKLSNLASYVVASGRGGQTNPGMLVGWTAPTLTYDKMRQVNASALALDQDITRNVTRQVFLSSWAAWFSTWKAFFDKYQGSGSDFAKLGAAFYSDDLANQAETYRQTLQSWLDAYNREKLPDGTAVPSSTAPAPPEPGLPPASAKNAGGIPWWLISLITLGVVGVGVGIVLSVRRQYRDLEAKREVLEKQVLPMMLTTEFGALGIPLANVAAARGRDIPPAVVVQAPPGL